MIKKFCALTRASKETYNAISLLRQNPATILSHRLALLLPAPAGRPATEPDTSRGSRTLLDDPGIDYFFTILY